MKLGRGPAADAEYELGGNAEHRAGLASPACYRPLAAYMALLKAWRTLLVGFTDCIVMSTLRIIDSAISNFHLTDEPTVSWIVIFNGKYLHKSLK